MLTSKNTVQYSTRERHLRKYYMCASVHRDCCRFVKIEISKRLEAIFLVASAFFALDQNLMLFCVSHSTQVPRNLLQPENVRYPSAADRMASPEVDKVATPSLLCAAPRCATTFATHSQTCAHPTRISRFVIVLEFEICTVKGAPYLSVAGY